MQQRTEEWLKLRKNKIGASDAPIIMCVSPWKSKHELWIEKMSEEIETECTSYMQRGIDLEPIARALFNEINSKNTEPSVIFHKKFEWMIASLDGMSEDGKTIVEIKCPGKKDHDIARSGKIPEKYYPQIQHQIEVAGVDAAYYFSFDGQDGVTIKVDRDQEYIDKMIAEELKFYECMQNFCPPDDCVKKINNNKMWDECAQEWKKINLSIEDAKQQLKQLQDKEDQLKSIMIEIAENEECAGAGIELKKYARKGAIDYSMIPEISKLNLENYRKNESFFWKIKEIK